MTKNRFSSSGRGPRRSRRVRVEHVDPRSDPAMAIAFARVLADDAETERALAVLAEITRLHPTATEAWALRGALALAVGDVALADSCSVESALALFRAGSGVGPSLLRPTARA